MDKVLEEIHFQMDLANGEYGNKDSYCIYCGSRLYEGSVGILHEEDCAIFLIRSLLKQ